MISRMGLSLGLSLTTKGGVTYVVDRFTDSNGTQVTAHTPDYDSVGGGWANAARDGLAPAAATSITSNQAATTVNKRGVVIDTGAADVIIKLEWTPDTSAVGRGCLLFRYQDNSNTLRFTFREDDNDVRLTENVAAADNILDSDSYTFTEGVTYRMKVRAVGTAITCFVNDVQVLSGTTSNFQTETEHGFGSEAGADPGKFDNFAVLGV